MKKKNKKCIEKIVNQKNYFHVLNCQARFKIYIYILTIVNAFSLSFTRNTLTEHTYCCHNSTCQKNIFCKRKTKILRQEKICRTENRT